MPKVGVDNIIVSNERKILLIRRSKESKSFPLCWGFIGGWMEEGELPAESLMKEAKEEIGVETKDHNFVGKVFSNVMPNEITRIVLPHLATVTDKTEFKLQKEEVAEVKWFPFDEALELEWAYDHKEIFVYALESGVIDKYLNNSIEKVIGDYKNFLKKVFRNLDNAGIAIDKYELDHIGYRATTADSYQSISKKLTCFGVRIHQNIIRNRPIDVYRLNKSLEYNGREIWYLEVLAPAEGDKFPEGLEHAEFIVDGIDLHQFIKKYPDLKWNLNALERDLGADVAVYFDDWANVKFKTMSILEIARQERKKELG